MGLNMFDATTEYRIIVADFLSSWKQSFLTEIEVDMADIFQKDVVFWGLNLCSDWSMNKFTYLPNLLDTVTCFRNNAGVSEIAEIADHILYERQDKELMYFALKKNLITSDVAYSLAEKILSEGNDKQEYMPMMIMKIHEEWEGGK